MPKHDRLLRSPQSHLAEKLPMNDSNARLFSYVLAHDTGFAPYVSNGTCTLATCKPRIRRTARRGDWIIGTSGRRYCDESNRIVYLMQVTADPLSFEDYDRAYPDRRPSPSNRVGDNIYAFDPERGGFQQRPHSMHGPDAMEHDLNGKSVLVSRKFVYFGRAMPTIPDHLDLVKRGPGHRCNFEPDVIAKFSEWINEIVPTSGWNRIHGAPNG